MVGRMTVIRDPLWNNVRIDATAMRLVDSRPFQPSGPVSGAGAGIGVGEAAALGSPAEPTEPTA